MKKPLLFFLVLLSWGEVACYCFNRLAPDRIIMRNGTIQEGLVIKNDVTVVVLEQPSGDRVIKKQEIERIDDANKDLSYFADLANHDKAPPWRMMVQDMRCNDAVKSFVQIPATRISAGYLKNVPYLSFNINNRAEMNIYGNPRDPACVEFGAYAHGEKLKLLQGIARQFFAGYIGSRSGLATLYRLDLRGDEERAGKFFYKVQPSSSPDSHGGWWLSIYDPVRLKKARVSDAVYDQMTLPSHDIRAKDGKLKHDLEEKHRQFLNLSMMRWLGKLPGFHGFYRDGNNKLQVMRNTN
ncbi:MAG: hypothetical protein NT164_02285 [Verrucomicrobiae bacterium]|nr:hypothetical protein [Verrucomicrobiae bacterium]